MSITFRPAVRERASLIIGLVGPSGGGKTMSALRLATGLSGTQPFAVIDTEAGRALHYAEDFRFDHGDLKPPFRPAAYAEAIAAADAAGYPVIVVDSFSHEHAGEGGLLDWHEEEFARLGHRDAVKMAAWIKPKMAHKQMVQKLLQIRAHLILCFRAEQKIEMKKNAQGVMEVVPMRTLSGFSEWIPIAEKSLLYEFTASLLLLPDAPGQPRPIKLEAQHRPFVPLDQPISEETGRQLAAWAAGSVPVGREPVRSLTTPPRQRESETEMASQHAGLEKERAPAHDRGLIKAQITGAADKLAIPPHVRATLAKVHLGAGTMDTADLSALQDLLTAVRAWRPGR